ncbi:DUF262 domain-containing protein [Flavobacterium branchiarum]|uniref:DUF262 domain-containing protein n=1 Tax=Flavobacterium branchiarum TaxID=1114870 RepID=A0ABV5FS89_9FLAO|nr:DUF262 domain-containing protein [Flavobacterium branchiarum]MDN3673473.1 DUF262 domain-containing protein [Flavobacterium branchiarum]
MVDYRVRSVSLLNLVNDVRKGILIPDAYFQRNLVWREIHNKDFIKTILLGYPFPQIFISKGKVDVAKMSTISCIVDGQQRTNALIKFIENQFEVDGKFYKDLTEEEQSNFLKYEVAVIELDLENDDPKVQEIFQRINRTSNSLTTIEKMASEYSTAEYMLVAKLLANQIDLENEKENEDFKEDPNIPKDFFIWGKKQKVNKFNQLITAKNIFTINDIAKKAHLMHILNIMSTVLTDFFNRNEKTNDFLNDYAINFDRKDEIVDTLEKTADVINRLKLKPKSYWFNKSNIFSLIVAIAKEIQDINTIDIDLFKVNLDYFEKNTPGDYKLSAKEGVNNKNERELRNRYLIEIINNSRN